MRVCLGVCVGGWKGARDENGTAGKREDVRKGRIVCRQEEKTQKKEWGRERQIVEARSLGEGGKAQGVVK